MPLLTTHWPRRLRAALAASGQVLLLAAQILVLAGLPSSYRRGPQRTAVLLHLYHASAPLLTGAIIAALASLVVIRIVVATATSYGLSQYALEVLVRTLVLELIPLYAALFVALRYALPGAQHVHRLLAQPDHPSATQPPQTLLRTQLLPRALAAMFSLLLLAAISCAMALLLTYLTVYGLSPWGLPAYTRSVGSIFTPAVTLIFSLKTLLFALAVAVVPLAAAARHKPPHDPAHGPAHNPPHTPSDITALAQLFAVLLLIELLSLLGNYL